MTMAFAIVASSLASTARAEKITLRSALDRAANRPSIALASLDIDAARALARGADVSLHNPELSAAAGGLTQLQVRLGLSQTIERGGKRDARVRLADAEARAAGEFADAERMRARVEAWRMFERALVLRDRLATQREVERLARELVETMQRAARAGGATALRVNVVRADAGRATRERIAAESAYRTTLAQLAAAIGAGPAEVLEPIDDERAGGSGADLAARPRIGTDIPAIPATVDELVARALRRTPAAIAAERGLEIARGRVDDADARGTSDITLGIAYEYAPDPDGAHAILGTLAVPLAIRNRNEGPRAAARIGVRRAELESAHVRVEIEREVRVAVASYERARDAVAAYDGEVLAENLAAAQDAFASGGLQLVELTAFQRELIESRLAYLDARLALVDAWAAVALATAIEVAP